MVKDIGKLIAEMTLEEKAGLCSGLDMWHTKPVERLGIPSIMMADGPHGLRKSLEDEVDPAASVPATCFPTAAAMACTWDRELLEKVGTALGEECQAEGVSIILGPGGNIKRSPLCGRNFEYFSEDPFLSSELAASHIKGVQSQGVGASLKHFAVNNQETLRMTINAVVDERTLREIYLAAFEGAVVKAQPWTVMCSYNRLNGVYCSENSTLLTEILKDEWNHKGLVISDWGAVNERAEGLYAGLELEMPSSRGAGDRKIVEAVKKGILSEKVLDRAVERLLTIIFKAAANKKKNASYDKEAHHALARKVASESMVLLKNEDNILPLKKEGRIAVIGAFAKQPRYQGGGSSHINPTMLDKAYDEIVKAAYPAEVIYAEGYKTAKADDLFNITGFAGDDEKTDYSLIREAKAAAASADAAVIFAGLPDSYEFEGFDREHMRLPEAHRKLIEAVARVQENTVVVLSNGSPVEMPWLGRVKGVLEGYLAGQAGGGAATDILFGKANPCGKLAETFPKRLCDNPSYLSFPGDSSRVVYGEGLFVGYRYYEAKEMEPLFPFGYGLSYTNFEYSGMSMNKQVITDKETLEVKVRVKNTGRMAGREIVQLYVRDVETSVIRPYKELKGFEKVALQPGEEKTVAFTLNKRAFAYYNTEIADWHVESGDFEILIGRSSADIVLRGTVKVNSTTMIKKRYNRNSTVADVMDDPSKAHIVKPVLSGIMEKFGAGGEVEAAGVLFMAMPLRALFAMSGEAQPEERLAEMLDELNRDNG